MGVGASTDGCCPYWTLSALSRLCAGWSFPQPPPEVKRLLGSEGTLGEMLGLDADWSKRAIMAGGNYGEIFARNIGEETPIGLARGLNAQWTEGGLIYSPPFR